MELKEVIGVLSYEKIYSGKDCSCHISPPCDKCVNKPDEEAREEAILTAISHLETLQRVKEAGGVKWKTNMCEFDPRVDIGEINKAERKGWNDCLDAVNAELAEKLEGLTPEKLHDWYLEAIKKLKPGSYNSNAQKKYDDLTEEQKAIDVYICKATQELILGKKEE